MRCGNSGSKNSIECIFLIMPEHNSINTDSFAVVNAVVIADRVVIKIKRMNSKRPLSMK